MEGIYSFPGIYTFLLVVGLVLVMKVYSISTGLTKDDIGGYSILGNKRSPMDKRPTMNNIDFKLSRWLLMVAITSPKVLYNNEKNMLSGGITAMHITVIIMFIRAYWNSLLMPFFKQMKKYITDGIPKELYLKDLVLITILPCVLKDMHNLIKNIQIYKFHLSIGPRLLIWTHSMIILIRGRQCIARYQYSKSKRHLLGLVRCLIDFVSLMGDSSLIMINSVWLSRISTILSIGWDLSTFYKANPRLKIVALILTYCQLRKLILMKTIISKTIYGGECMSHHDLIKTVIWFMGRIELIILNKKDD